MLQLLIHLDRHTEFMLKMSHRSVSRCFSCSHFFLSNGKQSAMSKRSQEGTSKEGSAVAKPRPMNLESKNLLSAKNDPPQDLSYPNSPGNQELDHSCVSARGKKLLRNANQNPTMYSQERQGDAQSSSTRKLGMRSNWSEVRLNSTTCRSPTIDILRKSSRTCRKS